jgi:hypothetical protein
VIDSRAIPRANTAEANTETTNYTNKTGNRKRQAVTVSSSCSLFVSFVVKLLSDAKGVAEMSVILLRVGAQPRHGGVEEGDYEAALDEGS